MYALNFPDSNTKTFFGHFATYQSFTSPNLPKSNLIGGFIQMIACNVIYSTETFECSIEMFSGDGIIMNIVNLPIDITMCIRLHVFVSDRVTLN